MSGAALQPVVPGTRANADNVSPNGHISSACIYDMLTGGGDARCVDNRGIVNLCRPLYKTNNTITMKTNRKNNSAIAVAAAAALAYRCMYN